MNYEIESNTLLFEINRTEIMDISVGDEIAARHFPQGKYKWTQHDSQFLESNPDARLFLKVEKNGNSFKGVGVMVLPQEN